MAAYKMQVVSFDGDNAIAQDGVTYNAYFDNDGDPLASYNQSPIVAEIARDHPVLIGATADGKSFPLHIEVKNLDQANIDALKQKFSQQLDRLKYLIVQDGGGSNRRLKVLTQGIISDPESPALFTAVLYAARAIWESTTEDDSTESITASGERWTINNGGSAAVYPQTIIKPTSYKAAADAPAKMRHAVVANRSPYALTDALGNPWPIDITNGGWDVETKVKAGTLHPSGYDIHVLVNGVEINRYLSNYGTGYGVMTAAEADLDLTSAVVLYAARFKLPGCSEGETNAVDEIQIAMRKSASPTGNMTLKIYADGSNGPTGAALATSNTVSAAGLGTSYAAAAFTFGSPVTLTAETWYWAAVDATACTLSGTNKMQIGVSSAVVTPAHESVYEGDALPSAISADSGATWSKGSGTVMRKTIHFRVFVTGSAKIWVPMALAPMTRVTLARSIFTGTGNVLLTLADADGHARLPDRGCLLLVSTTTPVVSSAVVYSAKRGTDQLLVSKRPARGTSDATFLPGSYGYLVDADVRVVFDHEAPDDLYKPAFEPRSLAPVIDGVNSTNTSFRWIGPFLAPDEQGRPGAWRSELDDTVDLYTSVTLDTDAAGDDGDITFKDASAAGSFVNRNAIVQHFPVGIESGSNITIDEASIAASLQLEHILTNERGEESIVATHRITDAGTGKTVTPADEAYRYRIRCRNGNVVAIETNDAVTWSMVWTVTYNIGNTFTLSEDTLLTAMALRLKCAATRTFTATFVILACDGSGVPQHGEILAQSASFTQAALSTSFQTILKEFLVNVHLGAGTYFAGIRVSAVGGSGAFDISAGTAIYPGGSMYGNTNGGSFTLGAGGGSGTSDDVWLRLFGNPAATGTATGTGGTADIDNIIVPLDDTTPTTPLVLFEAADLDCYLLDAYLENTTTVEDTGITVEEALDASETAIDVTDARPFAGVVSGDPVTIQVDAEQMTVTAGDAAVPDALTVVRGANGTTGATHAAGARIYIVKQIARLRAVMQTGEELEIDWAAGTILHSDDDLSEPGYMTALAECNEEDPFRLAPGNNVLKWTEAGVVATAVRHRFRDAYL